MRDWEWNHTNEGFKCDAINLQKLWLGFAPVLPSLAGVEVHYENLNGKEHSRWHWMARSTRWGVTSGTSSVKAGRKESAMEVKMLSPCKRVGYIGVIHLSLYLDCSVYVTPTARHWESVANIRGLVIPCLQHSQVMGWIGRLRKEKFQLQRLLPATMGPSPDVQMANLLKKHPQETGQGSSIVLWNRERRGWS